MATSEWTDVDTSSTRATKASPPVDDGWSDVVSEDNIPKKKTKSWEKTPESEIPLMSGHGADAKFADAVTRAGAERESGLGSVRGALRGTGAGVVGAAGAGLSLAAAPVTGGSSLLGLTLAGLGGASAGYGAGDVAGNLMFGPDPAKEVAATPAHFNAGLRKGNLATGFASGLVTHPADSIENLVSAPYNMTRSVTDPMSEGKFKESLAASGDVGKGLAEFAATGIGAKDLYQKSIGEQPMDFQMREMQHMAENDPFGLIFGAKMGWHTPGQALALAKYSARKGLGAVTSEHTATDLYRSAMKPTVKEGKATEVADAITRGLEGGIEINRKGSGLERVIQRVEAKEDMIQGILDPSTERVSIENLDRSLDKIRESAADDIENVDMIRNTADKYVRKLREHSAYDAETDSIPVQTANAIKRRLYKNLRKGGAYDEGQVLAGRGTAAKGTARSLMTAIEDAVPELGPLNKELGADINLQRYLERATRRIENSDVLGMRTRLAMLMGVAAPKYAIISLAAAITDNPSFKSRLAIAIHKANKGKISVGEVKRIVEDIPNRVNQALRPEDYEPNRQRAASEQTFEPNGTPNTAPPEFEPSPRDIVQPPVGEAVLQPPVESQGELRPPRGQYRPHGEPTVEGFEPTAIPDQGLTPPGQRTMPADFEPNPQSAGGIHPKDKVALDSIVDQMKTKQGGIQPQDISYLSEKLASLGYDPQTIKEYIRNAAVLGGVAALTTLPFLEEGDRNKALGAALIPFIGSINLKHGSFDPLIGEKFNFKKYGGGANGMEHGAGTYLTREGSDLKVYSGQAEGHKGHIYDVKFDAKVSELINGEKPMSKQHPDVIRILKEKGLFPEESSITGEDFYNDLADKMGGDVAVSELLDSHGIKGMKDIGRPGDYLSFNDSNLDITHVNGKPFKAKAEKTEQQKIAEHIAAMKKFGYTPEQIDYAVSSMKKDLGGKKGDEKLTEKSLIDIAIDTNSPKTLRAKDVANMENAGVKHVVTKTPDRGIYVEVHDANGPVKGDLWRYIDGERVITKPRGSETIAGVSARYEPISNRYIINYSDLPADLVGKGLGVAMYDRLVQEAHGHDIDITSDVWGTSPEASKIYDALKRRGLKVNTNPKSKIDEVSGGTPDPTNMGSSVWTMPKDQLSNKVYSALIAAGMAAIAEKFINGTDEERGNMLALPALAVAFGEKMPIELKNTKLPKPGSLPPMEYYGIDKAKADTSVHASPHAFNEFDIYSNVGRGQGMGAFGEGLYSAKSRGVQDSYFSEFFKRSPSMIGGKPVPLSGSGSVIPKEYFTKLNNMTVKQAIESLTEGEFALTDKAHHTFKREMMNGDGTSRNIVIQGMGSGGKPHAYFVVRDGGFAQPVYTEDGNYKIGNGGYARTLNRILELGGVADSNGLQADIQKVIREQNRKGYTDPRSLLEAAHIIDDKVEEFLGKLDPEYYYVEPGNLTAISKKLFDQNRWKIIPFETKHINMNAYIPGIGTAKEAFSRSYDSPGMAMFAWNELVRKTNRPPASGNSKAKQAVADKLRKYADDALIERKTPQYKVQHAPEESYIDYTATLGAQHPYIRDRLRAVMKDLGLSEDTSAGDGGGPRFITQKSGWEIYKNLGRVFANKLSAMEAESGVHPAKVEGVNHSNKLDQDAERQGRLMASRYLNSIGIGGIRYPAAGLSNTTHPNYVHFHDPSIVETNIGQAVHKLR